LSLTFNYAYFSWSIIRLKLEISGYKVAHIDSYPAVSWTICCNVFAVVQIWLPGRLFGHVPLEKKGPRIVIVMGLIAWEPHALRKSLRTSSRSTKCHIIQKLLWNSSFKCGEPTKKKESNIIVGWRQFIVGQVNRVPQVLGRLSNYQLFPINYMRAYRYQYTESKFPNFSLLIRTVAVPKKKQFVFVVFFRFW